MSKPAAVTESPAPGATDAAADAADAAAAKIDGMTTSASQQAQSVQNMKEELDKMALEMTALDTLASRTKNNEDAISAIDDFRRSTNREILQIKQQMGTAPK